MGLGPNRSSLLHKLGKLKAHEMEFSDFVDLIKAEQERRTIARSMGRLIRMNKEKPANSSPSKRLPKARTLESFGLSLPKARTLESFGLSAELIAKLRASGKTDSELIQILNKESRVKTNE